MSAFGIKAAVWVVLAALAGLWVVSLRLRMGVSRLARYQGDATTTRKD